MSTQKDLLLKGIIAEGGEARPENIFVDEVSGWRKDKCKMGDRKAGKELLAKLQKGDHLVVTRVDRLGRRMLEILNLVNRLDEMGVHVHALDMAGSPVTLTSSIGKMMLAIMALGAEMESDNHSARKRAVIKWRREQGLPSAHPPYWCKREYKTDPSRPTKRVPIDVECPERRAVCDRIIYLRSCGHSEARVAEILNHEKVPFYTSQKNPVNKSWNRDKICRIIMAYRKAVKEGRLILPEYLPPYRDLPHQREAYAKLREKRGY